MKVSRHAKIIELISQYDIETQEELAEYLNNAGFKVTQATVSRDIRDLKLTQDFRKRRKTEICDSQTGRTDGMSEKYMRVLKDGYQSPWIWRRTSWSSRRCRVWPWPLLRRWTP